MPFLPATRSWLLGTIVLKTRFSARVVPVGERAGPAVGGEVGPQPPLLRRPGLAAADLGAVRVQGDDVPAAPVEGVVAGGGGAGRGAEVAEVARGVGGVVVVVARGGVGARLRPAPARGVAAGVLRGGSVAVGVVSQREHRGARRERQQVGRDLVAGAAALG